MPTSRSTRGGKLPTSTPNGSKFSQGGHAREDLRGEDNNWQRNDATFNDLIAENKKDTSVCVCVCVCVCVYVCVGM